LIAIRSGVGGRCAVAIAASAVESKAGGAGNRLQGRISEIEDRFAAETKANDQKHETRKMLGIYGAGAGFALLIVVSLFLAFLSMERQMRILERLSNASS
jgi:hypothetical protein